MKQPEESDILAVMCAPSLVCNELGIVEALNEPAVAWLGITAKTAVGQSVDKLFFASDEQLPAFLQRASRIGHSACKGHLYRVEDNCRSAALSCHAQRLQGLQSSGKLLLVLTQVEHGDGQSAGDSHGFPWGNSINVASDHKSPDTLRAECADDNGTSALSDVAIGLVHEVNQPLTAIAAYAHSCRRWLNAGQSDHPKLLPTVDKIIEQVHVTGQMINSLKGLVRGHEDERLACDLNELVRESLELLALDPRSQYCVVDLELQKKPCPVVVSAVQMKIVLVNLLRNALEASLTFDDSDLRLRVSVMAEGKKWANATISDSGAGVTAEVSEQLFQPFVTSKSNGLGLGLVISRCLAAAHAGRIDYQPGVPQGASFQLRLPLAGVS